jgi:hypothetical protein
MNSIQLLREQFKSAHDAQEAVMKDVTSETAHFDKTNKALPVGAAYAHSVMCEDIIMSPILTQKEPVSSAMKTGLSEPIPSMKEWDKHEAWTRSVRVDLPVFRAYAEAVYKATDEYLTTLKESDLDSNVEMHGFGSFKLSFILTNFFLLHTANLTGEISAAKGIQGLKGYPF